MSFGFSVLVARGEDPAKAIVDAYAGPPAEHQKEHGTADEAFGLVAHAADAARLLVAGLGKNWATAHVNVAGHANPWHAARPGWANDAITVSVSVASYLADTDPALT